MEFKNITSLEVIDQKRTPAEESFYESFLLQKNSDVGNLYASNIYEGQCYRKTIKHIDRERTMHVAEMEREMKKVQKKLDNLKEKGKREDSSRLRQYRQFSEAIGCGVQRSISVNDEIPLPYLDMRTSLNTYGSLVRARSELSIPMAQRSHELSASTISLNVPMEYKMPSGDCVIQKSSNSTNRDNKDRNLGLTVFVTDIDKKDMESNQVPRRKCPQNLAKMNNLGLNHDSSAITQFSSSKRRSPIVQSTKGFPVETVRSQKDTLRQPDSKKKLRSLSESHSDDEQLTRENSVYVRYIPQGLRTKPVSSFPKI